MKILTKKKQDKLLDCIVECEELLIRDETIDLKTFDEFTMILEDMAYKIAGFRGLNVVSKRLNNE